MKTFLKNTAQLLSITFLFLGCHNQNKIDTAKLFANYERDKFVLNDTASAAVSNGSKWTISLNDNNKFVFTGTNKTVNGNWQVNKKDGDDYFITLTSQSDTAEARLNGNIIYFDGPYKLFDSLFKSVIFVQTTKNN